MTVPIAIEISHPKRSGTSSPGSPRRPKVAEIPGMSPVKKNFVANLTGSGWSAILGLACTPLYVKFLGMEAYGLIGFYLTMNGVIQVLDLGLSPTMTREMARYSALPEKAGEARDFVRTLEIGYWLIGGSA